MVGWGQVPVKEQGGRPWLSLPRAQGPECFLEACLDHMTQPPGRAAPLNVDSDPPGCTSVPRVTAEGPWSGQ